MGWELVLHLSGDYYPDVVREFYDNMFHKTDRDLPSIISTVKVVLIVLDREFLSLNLGIRDQGELITIDTNSKIIEEDLD